MSQSASPHHQPFPETSRPPSHGSGVPQAGPRRVRTALGVASLAGVVLGLLDLVAQRVLPYPWANLANSPAVWALAAFVLGAWVARGRWLPAAAGVVLLVVAVEAYEAAAVVGLHDNTSLLLTENSTVRWLLSGVLAGALFGAAGSWSRRSNGPLRVLGVALPVVAFMTEAAAQLLRLGDRNYDQAGVLETAAITLTLAVLVLVLAWRGGAAAVGQTTDPGGDWVPPDWPSSSTAKESR